MPFAALVIAARFLVGFNPTDFKPTDNKYRGAAQATDPSDFLELRALAINDGDFSQTNAAGLTAVLAAAERAYLNEFATPRVHITMNGAESSRQFFAQLPAEPFAKCLEHYARVRINAPNEINQADLRAQVSAFLARWPLDSLIRAFPVAIRPDLTSYEQTARVLIEQMHDAALVAFSAHLDNGQAVLDNHTLGRRFSDWLCALAVQKEHDIIITNAYVYYDLMREPYPHAVYHQSRLSGGVMPSPLNPGLFGRGILISTFGLDRTLPELAEPDGAALSSAEKIDFLGTYILAHELGHAVLKIPDVYDHGDQCLMSTDYLPSYVAGYRRFNQATAPCQRCRVYGRSRASLLQAELLFAHGSSLHAERALRAAFAEAPADLEGGVGDYAASLFLHLGQSSAKAGEWLAAEHFASEALVLDPATPLARRLLMRARRHQARPARKD